MINYKIYASIDIAKLFFALCIVILHGRGLAFFPYSIYFFTEKIILRLAVPFFFVCSGYFLSNTLKRKNGLKIYCTRLIKPLLVFEAINIVFEVIKLILKGSAIGSILKDVISHVLFYPYGALWYLQASIIGAVLLYPFVKKNKIGLAFFIGIVLYCFALICNNYYFIIANNAGIKMIVDGYLDLFISARNGVFVGFLFLCLGFYVERYKSTLCRKPVLISLIFLMCIEVLLLYGKEVVDDGALLISHIFLMPSLVAFLIEHNLNVKKETSIKCRNLSTAIYLQHRIYISAVDIFNVFSPIYIINPLKCVITIFLSWLVFNQADKKKIEPLCTLLR